MPYRITPFVTGQIYHIYNRGTEKRRIFENRNDLKRFLKVLKYYQIDGRKPSFSKFSDLYKVDPSKKIVEILVYCLMPNHFHLVVKQVRDGGVTEFISKFSNSYTKYFNTKRNRVGALFQGQLKAVLIENDEQLLHVSRYIHLNPLASFLVEDLDDYEWSSYHEYINNIDGICDKVEILGHFASPQDYKKFILNQADYAQQLEIIKHQLIDEK